MGSEIEVLKASFEEFKASSAAVEEDLEYEIASYEKIIAQKDLELAHTKQALSNMTTKHEQSRDQFKRQTVSLEKQVDAFELTVKRMTDEKRNLEQQKDNLERSNRVLQTQCEEQAEICEILVEKEAVARLGMEDLEVGFHRANLTHQTAIIKLRAAFKLLYVQLRKLGHAPSIELPDATPEEQTELQAEGSPDETITREAREKAFRKFVEVVTVQRLQDQLATALAQMEQSKRRIQELEQSDDSPRPSTSEELSSVPELAEEKTLNEGFLVKRGEGTLASWKRHIFKINRETHALEYYFVQVRKNKTKRIKLGEIALPQASITVAQKEGAHDHLFHLKPRFSKRTYVLQAASAEERNFWLSALSYETVVTTKMNPDSTAEDQFRIERRGKGFQPCYCILLKSELQLYHQKGDEKAFFSYPLKDCQMVYLPSEKHLLAFDHGPGLEVQHVILECESAEKLGVWTSLLENGIVSEQKNALGMEPEEKEDTVEVDVSVALKGPLKMMDESKEFWESFHFVVSSDTNFLDFYEDAGGNGPPVGTIPLLSTRQHGTSTAIISSYPTGAYLGHDHVFGITPPFSNITWLLEASSKKLLVRWMDGLVTLLDSKVARDPFSAKEGYLYKAVKDSLHWGKKYVMLDPPEIKYYKAGRHTNATVLVLTADSQILLRAPTKKFAVVFSLREGPANREYLWGSKEQAVGESWMSAIQAVITKRRSNQPHNSPPPRIIPPPPPPFSRGQKPPPPLLPPEPSLSESKGGPRQVLPRTLRTRAGSAVTVSSFTRVQRPEQLVPNNNNTSVQKAVETERLASAAVEFAAIVRQRTEDKRSTLPGSTNLASLRYPASLSFPPTPSFTPSASSNSSSPLSSVSSSSSPSLSALATPSASSLNFNFNFHAPKKSATLNVLKSSLFSTARWAPMVFELSRNGRVLTYFDAEKHSDAAAHISREVSDHCLILGCRSQPFARFGGLCAHHYRKSKRKKSVSMWYLVGAEVESHSVGQYPGHGFTFGLSGPGGPTLVIEALNAQERMEWIFLLTESGQLKRYLYPDSVIEGRLAQFSDGEWKEKYYVVREGRFECYNRSNRKRAWEMQLRASTQVCPEAFGLDFKPSSFSCVNADRIVDPESVFTVSLEKDRVILGGFTGESSRDSWIEGLQSCIDLAL